MTTKHIILAIALMLTSSVGRAESVRDFFISEPGNVFELLTQGVRAAMITMAEQGQKIESENLHHGTAKIDSLSSTFMSVKCSDVKQVELKLLTKGTSDTVIAVVETMQLPALDSRISFYDSNWHPLLLNKYMKGSELKMTDFFRPGTPKEKMDEFMRIIRFPLIMMTFGKNDGQLVASQQLKSFLSREDYNKIKPYLIDTITFDIDKVKLKRTK
ncbi:MAG: DUF3256 family protein [Bacteroidales bacterium]|nr:DUF3256 family protein [Bacteroidales bacterium]